MKLFLRLSLALLLTLLLLAALALQRAPSLPQANVTTPTDARALKALVERHDPRRLLASRPAALPVQAGELNLVLTLLAQQRPGLLAVAELQDGRLRLRVSQRLGPLWLNARADLLQTAGWPALDEVRLGRLPLPAWACKAALLALLDHHHALAPLRTLRVLGEQIRFQADGVSVMLHWRPDSTERLLDGLWPEPERERALVYHQALVGFSAGRLPGLPVALAEVLPPLFTLAAQRSAGGANAADENRMALLTLAVHTTGRGWAPLLPAARAWPRVAPLSLRLVGRDDFPLHWLYSAAIAVSAGGPLADLIGLDKELSDAHGGSGFSFNDIAADRAGTRLGLLALQQPEHVQRLLGRQHADSLLMPAWVDLPEFVPEAEFQRQYGGTQGAGYRAMMARIEARLDAMPLFQP